MKAKKEYIDKFVEIASKEYIEEGDRDKKVLEIFSKLRVSVEKFPFSDNYFDTVFAGEIIEHLYNPDHLLAETYRVLKPKGIFVLTPPNLASIHNRITSWFSAF